MPGLPRHAFALQKCQVPPSRSVAYLYYVHLLIFSFFRSRVTIRPGRYDAGVRHCTNCPGFEEMVEYYCGEGQTLIPYDTDPRRYYSVFFDDPSPTLHPFVLGVLTSKSRALQCAAFQLATHHAFHADYSSSFRPTAGDNTSCPHCGDLWTMNHVLFDCPEFWEPRGMVLDPIYHNTTHQLFSSKNGGRRLVEFLHATQALLRPLPPRPTGPP
jgi:hypothetical protein